MKLKKLTPKQEQKLTEFRAEMFAQATSTAPADRPRAEAAARRMAEIAGVSVFRIIWVTSPEAGAKMERTAWHNLWGRMHDSFYRDLYDRLNSAMSDSLWAEDSMWASLRDRLSMDQWRALHSRLKDSLYYCLYDSQEDALLKGTCNNLRQASWTAFFTFPAMYMGVAYEDEAMEKLRLRQNMMSSAFALWIVPGTIILCDRPKSVEIVDGKPVRWTWRKDTAKEK